jgi:ABC-2 type transport system ATP-binding protein
MDGAPMSSAPAPQAGGQAEAIAPGPSAVVVDEVSYRFGEHTAVDHVNLAIELGETFGLLGPNGAGKTTTLLKPMTGRITVFGTDTGRIRCGSAG